MQESLNLSVINSTLLDKLKSLGKCEYTCVWSEENDYYENSIITKADIPDLIALATSTDYFHDKDHGNYCIPIHAWRLLGRLKVIDSIVPLIECLEYYPDSDWCYHELPHVFAMMGNDVVIPLSQKLKIFSANEFISYVIIESLTKLAISNILEAPHIIDLFADQLDNEKQESINLNTLIVQALIELGATFKIQNIADAIERNVVYTDKTGYVEDIEIDMGILPSPFNTPTFLSSHFFDSQNKQTVDSKVGRNETCPCGSGKKYKKCCIE